jgi:hypothetical protein
MNCTIKEIVALRDCIIDGAYEGYDNSFIDNGEPDYELIADYIISGILDKLDRHFSLEVTKTKKNTNN